MMYFITIILSLSGVIRQSSKVLFVFLFVWLWIIFGWNYANGDYQNYLYNYDYEILVVESSPLEIGYIFFAETFKSIGFSFQQFLQIYSLLGLMLIGSTIYRFSNRPSLVMILYLIYPFFWDVNQIRNFMAMAIVIFFSRYILTERRNYLKFLLGILLASSFHTVAFIYILFIFINKVSIKTLTIYCIVSFLMIALTYDTTVSFISNVFQEKSMDYFTTTTSYLTKTCILIYFLLIIMLLVRALNSYKENIKDYCNKNKMLDVELVLKANIILLFLSYFMLDNLHLLRVFRNIVILDYIIILNFINFKLKKNFLYLLLLLGVVVIGFGMNKLVSSIDLMSTGLNFNLLFK